VKPLDSNDAALVAAASDSNDGSNAREMPSVSDSDADVPTPRAQNEVVAVRAVPSGGTSGASRVSRIVPLGTSDDGVNDSLDLPAGARRHSEVVGRDPAASDSATGSSPGASRPSGSLVAAGSSEEGHPGARDVRAAALVPEFGATRMGTGFEPDEEDEATTVDAGAALTDDEREALARRIHSAMEETLPHGTPPPEPVQPLEGAPLEEPEPGRVRANPFKQTMLLGLPKLESPLPPRSATPVASESAVASGPEPALMASVVRVVGPPTQPPPRRSRRASFSTSALPSEPDQVPVRRSRRAPASAVQANEPDHEAFVLRHPIVAAERPKRSGSPPPSRRGVSAVQSAEPSLTSATPRLSVAVGRSSLPAVMLPPAPQPEDYEPASSPGTAPPPAALLRATIEPPASLSRTRPPMSPRYAAVPSLDELPPADPFAGFVAPQPSLAQRWLVVVVVALAVVGLCSLAAIALGFLGKTGW
jgi:hypothetical protein